MVEELFNRVILFASRYDELPKPIKEEYLMLLMDTLNTNCKKFYIDDRLVGWIRAVASDPDTDQSIGQEILRLLNIHLSPRGQS